MDTPIKIICVILILIICVALGVADIEDVKKESTKIIIKIVNIITYLFLALLIILYK